MTAKVNLSIFDSFKKRQENELKKRIEEILLRIEQKSLRGSLKYVLGNSGKMLRPILVLISTKAVGGKLKDAYNIAIAMELLHTSTLIHDDIMDRSEKRRGVFTLYKKNGLNNAILTGDILIVLAYHNLLKDCSINDAKKIISLFTKTGIEICKGQGLDTELESKEVVSISEYKRMIYKKTACFTEMCCEISARKCGAPDEYIKSVKKYGKYLGMAFQIQDDILDIFGNEKEMGKKIGTDLVEGKKTYLLIKALSKSFGKDKDFLYKILRKGLPINEITKYRNLCVRLGVLRDAEIEVIKYIKLASSSIKILPENEGKHLMFELLAKVNNRKNN